MWIVRRLTAKNFSRPVAQVRHGTGAVLLRVLGHDRADGPAVDLRAEPQARGEHGALVRAARVEEPRIARREVEGERAGVGDEHVDRVHVDAPVDVDLWACYRLNRESVWVLADSETEIEVV